MTNAFSTPLFSDDKLIRDSLTATIRTIPKVPKFKMCPLSLYYEAKREHKANTAIYNSLDMTDGPGYIGEDEEEQAHCDIEESFIKFITETTKIMNGGIRVMDAKRIIDETKKEYRLKWYGNQFFYGDEFGEPVL